MEKYVVEAFAEPACEHNSVNQAHKGCVQPTPGAASGGCSFDGAQITLLPIVDAAHLVHGPIACGGNSWEARGSLSSGSYLYQYGLTTDLKEQDIIFGGEQKLRGAIREIADRFSPPAIFVYSTCVTALIGVDLDSICKSESKVIGIPVIPVNSPGFVGSKNMGNRLAGNALMDHVIGTDTPPIETPFDINLIGEYNIAGEMWDIKELFDQVGIRILANITGDGRFHKIRWAHKAKLNMVVCSRALINMARKMEEKYDIPYFEGSFYGAKETTLSLLTISYMLNNQELMKKVRAFTKAQEEKLAFDLTKFRKKLLGKRAILYTGGVKSWSIISALQELGIEVVGVGTNKSTMDDIERIKERIGESAKLIESGGASKILETFRNEKADIIIAGGRNMYVALKEQIPFLDVNQERHHAYAGYVGLKRLAEQLVYALEHPIWELLQSPSPWKEVGKE
ncbi:nitrogenase iron-molybdenum cofactor biosynthesis protein NifE [Niallia sp. Sow4_A1]|uniref:Nitrogenase iron-molybdenum cofactor biosynthesis protein NifE n=1 Tax=Niallia hominis TaxID=3133173 RepID=A0ABV1F3H1_9BACI|nr:MULTISPECIES: nitrogenase iron-molybdenum cofactor biosynthesis protein NifE [Bacillaceae]MCF2647514.1 nitrogenase iron-molybdenum cofactor biosynthesis protein NifE [Niallia circulans]MCM3362919.1 nitrogenase iron-molybdenum cofactor biosynthesis protein NifE [Niallia sp. MER TA 168]CAI9389001.1 Nitrogenase molybdenum-iron protein alpha chain [Bacillus sp. T2.9-1]